MNTIILAIETSTDACSVAIITPDETYGIFEIRPQAHAEILLDMVEEICNQAGVELADISAIAFGAGPGSFTGVRIAAGVVQGLAFGAKKPVIPISSLQALAQQGFNKTNQPHIMPVIDARMKEVYWGSYVANEQGLMMPLVTDSLEKPDKLLLDPNTPYLAVGTGSLVYHAVLQANNPHINIDTSVQHPRAHEVAQLAVYLFAKGAALPPEQAIPNYVRNDVAEKKK